MDEQFNGNSVSDFSLTIVTCYMFDIQSFMNTLNSVESFIGKSVSNIEWLVWDATGQNSLIEVINDCRVKNISYYSQKDQGLYDGLNQSMQKAKGEYVLVINSGDRVLPVLGEVVELLDSNIEDGNGIDVFACPVATWKGKVIRPNSNLTRFVHQGLVYRKQLHDKYGKYSSLVRFTAADYLFFMIVFCDKSTTVQFVDKPIAYYDRPGLSANALHFVQRDVIKAAAEGRGVMLTLLSIVRSVIRFSIMTVYNRLFWK